MAEKLSMFFWALTKCPVQPIVGLIPLWGEKFPELYHGSGVGVRLKSHAWLSGAFGTEYSIKSPRKNVSDILMGSIFVPWRYEENEMIPEITEPSKEGWFLINPLYLSGGSVLTYRSCTGSKIEFTKYELDGNSEWRITHSKSIGVKTLSRLREAGFTEELNLR